MSTTLFAPFIAISTLLTTATTPNPIVEEPPVDTSTIYQIEDSQVQTLTVNKNTKNEFLDRDSYTASAPPAPVVTTESPSTSAIPIVAGQEPLTGTMKEQIVQLALQYKGVPYVFAGSTPNGWDCSGYVKWITGQVTGVNLPHGVGSIARSSAVHEVAEKDAVPGDFVVLSRPGQANYHMGIYLGEGRIVHAPRTGDVTKEGPVRWDTSTTAQYFSLNG